MESYYADQLARARSLIALAVLDARRHAEHQRADQLASRVAEITAKLDDWSDLPQDVRDALDEDRGQDQADRQGNVW